jgi:hypothetical protein
VAVHQLVLRTARLCTRLAGLTLESVPHASVDRNTRTSLCQALRLNITYGAPCYQALCLDTSFEGDGNFVGWVGVGEPPTVIANFTDF